jgi:hypothetical protein
LYNGYTHVASDINHFLFSEIPIDKPTVTPYNS